MKQGGHHVHPVFLYRLILKFSKIICLICKLQINKKVTFPTKEHSILTYNQTSKILIPHEFISLMSFSIIEQRYENRFSFWGLYKFILCTFAIR